MISFSKIDKKWQKKWNDKKIFSTVNTKKKKFYVLEMYPYPSASGLHVGHAFNYFIGDIFSRFKLMKGFNVLHPMGYDSFGLPAENAAIKNKSHPKKFTESAIKSYINQQKKVGLSYDWDRMLYSHDPSFYKWDQWIFLKMYEKGLAYKKQSSVNWCVKCNTVLANEQVHNGNCWRHKTTTVELKQLNQWFFKTTAYANELYDSIDSLKDWPDNIKAMQKNWIGKSYGTEINFKINGKNWPIFTTRPDTIYGVTFMVVSAQHPKLNDLVTSDQKKDVADFLKKIKSTSEKDIESLDKEGAFTGSYATHPLTDVKIPVYTGNFVVADYSSGMVMAVPAHDQRDFEFARKYKIPVKVVINPDSFDLDPKTMSRAFTTNGSMINSGEFNGLSNTTMIEEITKYLITKKMGKKTIHFKLRDWLISRQRFWGTPIPIVYCKKCGMIPVPENQLPVKLPAKIILKEGSNPLLTHEAFLKTKCPKCEGIAERESDTMDTFVNSSWYFLRYLDPKNDKEIFDKKKAKYWMPIDLYIGGAEHACMHLIYFRFYTKFLRDIGYLTIDEPTIKLVNQGMIHAGDGKVMSKSAGNVVDPLDMQKKYGADALRFFLISETLPDKNFNWSDKGIENTHKFLQKIYSVITSIKQGKTSSKQQHKLHSTIKKVTEYIKTFKYNLAVIEIRQLIASFEKTISKKDIEKFLRMTSPFMPHLTEELWSVLGNKSFISLASWPKVDEKKINPKYDMMDEFIETLIKDIEQVKKLVKFKPKIVKIFVSQSWKYDFFKKLKKEMDKDRNVGNLIKKLVDGKHNKEISKIVPSVLKNKSTVSEIILSQKEELKLLKDSKAFLEECGLKVSIGSEDDKARPGKPVIMLE